VNFRILSLRTQDPSSGFNNALEPIGFHHFSTCVETRVLEAYIELQAVPLRAQLRTKLRLFIHSIIDLLSMWGLLEQAGVRIVSSSLQSLRGFAPEALRTSFPEAWNAVQQRGLISIDVHGGKAEKALRTLKRKIVEEGFKDTWDAQRVFMKPTHERKMAATETAKRLKKRIFREKLRWIMRRNSRGF
jgi:ribosomal protein S21